MLVCLGGFAGFAIVAGLIVYIARPSLSLTTDLTGREIITLTIVGILTAVLMLWFVLDIPAD